MKTIQITAGRHIRHAAEELIDAAKTSDDGTACADFNGITITAASNSYVEMIVQDFHEKQERAAEEYRASPAGIASAKKSEDDRREAQATVDRCMAKLPTLDFSNDEQMLDWFCEIQSGADRIDVQKDSAAILSAFSARGFVPNMNLGADCNPEDKSNLARYIIGQGLGGFRTMGAPHQVIHHFTQQWKEKFVR